MRVCTRTLHHCTQRYCGLHKSALTRHKRHVGRSRQTHATHSRVCSCGCACAILPLGDAIGHFLRRTPGAPIRIVTCAQTHLRAHMCTIARTPTHTTHTRIHAAVPQFIERRKFPTHRNIYGTGVHPNYACATDANKCVRASCNATSVRYASAAILATLDYKTLPRVHALQTSFDLKSNAQQPIFTTLVDCCRRA